MTKEPNSGKKPEDEADLDDLDLESLLAEDEQVGAERATVPMSDDAGSKGEPPPDEELVLDEGEIDLLEEEAPAPAVGEPLPPPDEDRRTLAMPDSEENLLAPDEERQTLEMGQPEEDLLSPDEERQTLEMGQPEEDLLSLEEDRRTLEMGQPAADKGAGGSEDIEEVVGSDLIEEEATPTEQSAAEEEPVTRETVVDEPRPETSEEAAPQPPEFPAPEEKGRRPGKQKFGKGAKKFDKKEARAKKEKREEEALVAASAKMPRGSLTFVCSECYEEFLLSPNYSEEVVSCPECLHVGKRPDDSFLRTVNVHKAGEKKWLAMAIVCAALLCLGLLALLWVRSPYFVGDPTVSRDTVSMLTFGLLAGAGILTLVLAWLIVRFEGNRWEVYF